VNDVRDVIFAAKWNPAGTKLLTAGSLVGDFSVSE